MSPTGVAKEGGNVAGKGTEKTRQRNATCAPTLGACPAKKSLALKGINETANFEYGLEMKSTVLALNSRFHSVCD